MPVTGAEPATDTHIPGNTLPAMSIKFREAPCGEPDAQPASL